MITINVKNFPDVNFRRWLLKHLAEDGVLTDEILGKTTKINVNWCGIRNLKGIEHFTALTKLECCWNRLTSLDLSNNPALTELNCSFNEMTSLNLSNNPALRKLICDGANSQASDLWIKTQQAPSLVLNLSHNTALTELNCCCCLLKTLDLSNNTALAIMDCYDYNQGFKEASDMLIFNLPQTKGGVIFANDDCNADMILVALTKGWEMREGPQAVACLPEDMKQKFLYNNNTFYIGKV